MERLGATATVGDADPIFELQERKQIRVGSNRTAGHSSESKTVYISTAESKRGSDGWLRNWKTLDSFVGLVCHTMQPVHHVSGMRLKRPKQYRGTQIRTTAPVALCPAGTTKRLMLVYCTGIAILLLHKFCGKDCLITRP